MIKELITRGFARTIESYPDNAIVQKQISQKLSNLVSNYKAIIPSEILEIGCGTGFLTSELLKLYPNSNWTVNDINKEVKESIDFLFQEKSFKKPTYLFEDAEKSIFPLQYDLIITSSCLQWFTDPKTFLASISKKLKNDGLLAFSTFGSQNMQEIRAITTQGLKYYSIDDYTTMLSENYEVIYCAEDTVTLCFDEPTEVLKHLKATGVNGAFRQHWTKSHLATFIANYNTLLTEQGFPLTYHPIYFICKPL